MIAKILATICLLALPLSAILWHRSHSHPFQHRYDLTLYKSLRVYLRDGVCGMHLLSMPTKTASRSRFQTALTYDPIPSKRSFMLSSQQTGAYRMTWFAFPLWFSTTVLTVGGFVPVARGPIRQTWRRWKGLCLDCGYNLTGNHSGRCPECGCPLSRARR